ncbi:MAG: tetratricopeptide repeat protein, partial [Pirellula sp.]
ELQERLCDYVRKRVVAIYLMPGEPLDWELDGLLDTVPHLLTSNPDYPLAVDGMFLSNKVLSYRNVQSALKLLELTASRVRKLAKDDPNDAQKQRDLSISFERLGDVYLKLGRTDESLEQFMGGLTIRRKLAQDDPNDAQKQRDLMISFFKLGAVHQSTENLLMAVDEYEKGVRVLEQLIDKGLLVESSVREKEFLLSLIQQCRDGLNQGAR